MRVTVVVGNPKPLSRTRLVGEEVARQAIAAAGYTGPVELQVVELGELAGELFDFASPRVKAVVAQVSASDLVVVASPTYKATYTGLLKAFLDWMGQTALAGAVAVPVMVGGNPVHALAPEVFLRPLLVEVGAMTPPRGLFMLEGDLDRLDEVVAGWADGAGEALRRTLGGAPGSRAHA